MVRTQSLNSIDDKKKEKADQPVRQRSGITGANAAETRKAEFAKNQKIVKCNIQRQYHQKDTHGHCRIA